MSQQQNTAKVAFTVPLTPPSVNHYKRPSSRRVTGQDGLPTTRLGFTLTPEAKAWKQAVAIFARGETIAPQGQRARDQVRYALSARVYLGKGERGDGDNYWKCIADALVDAGVIHSDARVRTWYLEVWDTERDNPRTDIQAEVIEEE